MRTFLYDNVLLDFVQIVAWAFIALVVFELLQNLVRRVARLMKTDDWQGKNGGVPVPRRPSWPPQPPPLKPDRSKTVGTGTITFRFVLNKGTILDPSSFADPPSTYGGHDVPTS